MAEEKKKVLIFSHAMEIGGAEKALIGLLETFDTDLYDVSLFLMRHQGEWMANIPKNISLLPELAPYTCLGVPIREAIRRKQFGVFIGRTAGRQIAKSYVKKHQMDGLNDVALQYSHRFTAFAMPQIPGEYDLAISFLTPHYFVAKKVKAKKKIAWIHTDYSSVDMDVNEQLKMWSAYDHIISISDACTDGFLSKMPSLKDRIVRIDHMMPAKMINHLSQAVQTDMKTDALKLLSVGRFTYAKNFENIPYLCKKITDSGIDAVWYLVGYGEKYEKLIRKAIAEYHMEDRVIILGKKDNPYPYIRDCDVYLQPSRYEGKSITVLEAQILCKPVIITDYATAHSQLENGVDGMIVPTDPDTCAKEIISILNNPALLRKLSENCAQRDYTNKDEIQKIYQMLE